MKEKFSVINGGKTKEQGVLLSALEKVELAIKPFTIFDDVDEVDTAVSDFVRYADFSDQDLAFEAELLSGKLKNAGNDLSDLLIQAVTLRDCIKLRNQK